MSILSWMRGTAGGSGAVLAIALDELDAFYLPAKRKQLENLQALEMLAEDEASGAPPRAVNLDSGTAVIKVRRATGGVTDQTQAAREPAPAEPT